MAENTNVPVQPDASMEVVDKVTGFWQQNSKKILIGLTAIIVVAGGIVGYKYLVAEPKEKSANDAIFRAQQYFQQDSLALALNGDATNPGFLKIMDKYSGTKAANLAHFYAGAIYLKQGDFANAEKHLKDFSTSSLQISARAKSLLADTYAEQGKKKKLPKCIAKQQPSLKKMSSIPLNTCSVVVFCMRASEKTRKRLNLIN